MRNWKRILAALLALAMLFSMAAISEEASAPEQVEEQFETPKEEPEAEVFVEEEAVEEPVEEEAAEEPTEDEAAEEPVEGEAAEEPVEVEPTEEPEKEEPIEEPVGEPAEEPVEEPEQSEPEAELPEAEADQELSVEMETIDAASDFVIDENGVLTAYKGKGGNVKIPDGVTRIGDKVFEDNYKLKSISIPDSVKSIGSHAFSFTHVETVNFGNGVTHIGERAFYACDDLVSIEIPNSVTTLDDEAFGCCAELKSIDIPDSVTKLGERVFAVCESVKSVHIGSGLTSISRGTFTQCNLKSIDIPDNIKSIGDFAFDLSENLQTVHIGKGVTSIGRMSFYGCDALKSIVIPEGVRSIGESAFEGCDSLQSINIPKDVTSIGKEAFDNYSLTLTVEVASGSYGEQYCKSNHLRYKHPGSDQIYAPWFEISDKFAIENGVLLRYVSSDANAVIPNCVTSIADEAFLLCHTVKSVDIPSSVKSIGKKAFNWSNVQTVRIAEGVTSIGDEAFYYCFDMTSITIPESVTSIGKSAFRDHNAKLTATVVKDSYAEQYCKDNDIKYIVALGYVTVVCTPDEITLSQSSSQTIKVTSEGLGKTEKYSYSSSDKKIATVSSKGKITAKKQGTAIITVTGKTSKRSATCAVTVKPKPSSIKIVPPETTNLITGGTLQLNYELTPADAATTVKWSSSNKKVVAVDASTGLLTAKKRGSATITASTSNKKKSKLKINVVEPYEPYGIKLDQADTVTLAKGATLQLNAILEPDDAISEIKWESSAPKVAKVENGLVSALKVGSAKITAIAKKNTKLKAKVTVEVVKSELEGEPSADKYIYIFDQSSGGQHSGGREKAIQHSSSGYTTLGKDGCGLYASVHAYQWLLRGRLKVDKPEDLLQEFIDTALEGTTYTVNRSEGRYSDFFKKEGITNVGWIDINDINALKNIFKQGGVVKAWPNTTHYYLAVGAVDADLDNDKKVEPYIHIIDSVASYTIGIVGKIYAFSGDHRALTAGDLRISNNRSYDNAGALEYWLPYSVFKQGQIASNGGATGVYLPPK